MGPRNDSIYKEVASLDEDSSDSVIPSGEVWTIRKFVGAGAYLDDTIVSLIWDYGGAGEEMLASTHGDATIELLKELTGDGTKKLSIVLTNDTNSAHVMGGQWEGF